MSASSNVTNPQQRRAADMMAAKATVPAPVIMRTFWLSFHDERHGFSGVAIVDMFKSENPKLGPVEIITKTIELGINPGPDTDVLILDVTDDHRIKPEHKNRLILDETLLLSLGRRVEFEAHARKHCPCAMCSARG